MQFQKKDRQNTNFYSMVLVLVIPIVIQNLINTAVSAADTVMLGYVSQTALSASSLANQMFNILSFTFNGVGTGSAILAAQYWGKKDLDVIEQVLGLALRFALGFALLFFAAAFFFPSGVMSVYTNDTELIRAGSTYLRIISITYLLSAVTQMYLTIQRCVERVKLSTYVMTISLLLNVSLNACFIFGIGWFPKMGLTGVAVATCIARLFESTVCIVDSCRRNTLVSIRIRHILHSQRWLLKDFTRFSLPALLNDIVASVGASMYSVIMGHMGSDVVAANAFASVSRQFGTVFCIGVSVGTSIIVGRTLGENKLELAREYGKKSLRLAFASGIIGSLLMIVFRPVFLHISNLNGQAYEYLKIMLFIQAYYIYGTAMNATFFETIFRSGGDTVFGFLTDTITLWCWMIPMGFLLAFVIKLPPMWVYFFLCLDEFFKMPVCYLRYRSGKWVRNITHQEKSEEQ